MFWYLRIALVSLLLFVSPAFAVDVTKVDAIPYINEKGRSAYENGFLKESPQRVFAISPSANWGWASSSLFEGLESVKKRAIENCGGSSPTPCYLYAVNDEVVWNGPSPESLRKIRVDNLGFAIDMPERWKRGCSKTNFVTKNMHTLVCGFRDSENKASVRWTIRLRNQALEPWLSKMHQDFIKLYTTYKKKQYPYSEIETSEEDVALSNGTPASIVHKIYDVNGNKRYVSHLAFQYGDFDVWVAVFNSPETVALKGAEMEGVISQIVFQ